MVECGSSDLVYYYNSRHSRIERRQPWYSHVCIVDQQIGLSSELCDVTRREQHSMKGPRKMPVGYAVNLLDRFGTRSTFGEYRDRISSGKAAKYFVNISACST